MRKWFLVIVLALCALTPALASAQQPTPPPQLGYALQGLAEYFGRPVSQSEVSSYTYRINFYTDAALGCPYVAATPLSGGVQGFAFQIVLGGLTYDVRTLADGSLVFPCVPPETGLTPAPTPLFTPALTPIPVPASECPPEYAGFLPPRLAVGAQARIAPSGLPNRIRNAPSLNGAQIGTISPGGTVRVIGGPSCDAASNIIWWQIEYNNITGWTAEGVLPDDYFLEPVGTVIPPTAGPAPSRPVPLPAERDVIAISNIEGLAPLAALDIAEISEIAFSPDGTRMALAGVDGLTLYTLPDLAVDDTFSFAETGVSALAFNGPAQLIFGTYASQIFIVNLGTGQRVPLPDPPTEGVNSLSVFPPARLVAASGALYGGTGEEAVYLYDLVAGEMITRIEANFWVNEARFSPSGQYIAYFDTVLHVLDVNRGAVEIPAVDRPLFGALAWQPALTDPARSVLAYATAEDVRTFDIDSGVERSYAVEEAANVAEIGFSPDGALLVTLTGQGPTPEPLILPRLDILDVETGDVILSFDIDGARTFSFSPDGTLLAVAVSDQMLLFGIA